jgi:hypothetical protein
MLSREERAGMLAEAADPRRREVLAAARLAARSAVTPAALLEFLTGAGTLLVTFSTLPRRRLGIGHRYLL